MRKLLFVSVALLMTSPAMAAGFSFGGGFNFGNVRTGAGTASIGSAAAGSLSSGTNNSIGAGVATTTPVGSFTAGVGASAGGSRSSSGAVSIGNGAAVTGGFSNNVGAGAGLGVAIP